MYVLLRRGPPHARGKKKTTEMPEKGEGRRLLRAVEGDDQAGAEGFCGLLEQKTNFREGYS